MIGPDNALWKQCWRDQATDFHLPATNSAHPGFGLSCGQPPHAGSWCPCAAKSLDLLWLSNQGCEVVGVELSPVAISAFSRNGACNPAAAV